jgi:myosin heavy subunit
MVPAKLLSYGGGSAKFELEDGTVLVERVDTKVTYDPLDTQCLDANISNLIELKSLSEKAVLHVLRIRFMNDDIYTLVSGILIACNPFKAMNIYDKETMDTYRRTRDHSTLPPHIFSLANEAYTSMVQTGSPQSVVISGESGAGKTESIKLILKYLARLSEITSNSSKSVQDQILCANPLLEAFGNAKTSRNNNSSRFGKLITVNFSGGVINQASIISYLLEKSRVVHQQLGERNYHVFYQLLAACTSDPKFGIANGLQDSAGRYSYLSDPESSYLYCVNELESFSEVEKSMEILGMNKGRRAQIFQVVACVLRLGDVQFNVSETADARALIDDVPEIDRICDMLGIQKSEMKRCLVSRNFGVRSVVTCFFSVQQARDTRDAFAKALYSYLFNWLIKTVNTTLTSGNKSSAATGQFIALLDIFGFEKFETNSFEQLLINYCNEKLQYHFNSHIFVMEQEAYKLEGIDIGCINFKDNSPTLSAIEAKPKGILAMMDEEINIPKGSDLSLLNKLFTAHSSTPCISRAKPASKRSNSNSSSQDTDSHLISFVIKHYAGQVPYEVTGFLEKNKDSLSQDLMYIGKNSTVPFVAELFLDFENMTNDKAGTIEGTSKPKFVQRSTAKSKGPTIATQFKKQLGDLIETLNSTSPFFVRCMKTNPLKTGGVFDSNIMLKQLQYSGLLEVCRIRQDGYPCRFTFQAFYSNYWKLNPASQTGPLLARDLEANGLFGPNDYRIGENKIFLKYDTGHKLEYLRGDSINGAANTCQAMAKVFLAKRRLKRVLKTYGNLKAVVKSRDRVALSNAVDLGKKFLPYEGMHLPALNEAKATLVRMNEEDVVIKLMTDALASKNFSGMEHAVAEARAMKPMLSSPLVRTCEQALKAYLKGKEEEKGESSEGVTTNAESKTILPAATNIPPPPPTTTATTTSPPAPVTTKIPFSSKSAPSSNDNTHQDRSQHGTSWGTPSAIKSAKGISPVESSSPPPGKSKVHAMAERFSGLKVENEKPKPKPTPPPLVAQETNDGRASDVSDDANIVDPNVDYKSKRRTFLERQLSADQIDMASEVHGLIETLSSLSMSEAGIVPNDIRALEIMLKKISIRDDAESKDMVKKMMGEEELVRAKKQLLLQTAVDKVKSTTPAWKLKNLAAQARQIGMENYQGKFVLDALLNQC